MKALFFALVSIIATTPIAQDETALRKKNYNIEGKLAIEGYDPVAYFKSNKAIKGKKEWACNGGKRR